MEISQHFSAVDVVGAITFGYRESVDYSYIQTYRPFFTSFALSNRGSEEWSNVQVRLSGEHFEDSCTSINTIPAGADVCIPDLVFAPKASVMAFLEKRCDTTFRVTVNVGGKEVYSKECAVVLLPYNEWIGVSNPEQLCSFVARNAASLDMRHRITARCGDGIEGYNRGAKGVAAQVEAVYDVLQALPLASLPMSATWLERGLCVRTPSDVLASQAGTGLDLTLLMCSLLESLGLMPCVVLLNNKVATAVWTAAMEEQYSVVNDYKEVAKYIRDGSLMVFDTLSVTNAHRSFAEAKAGVDITASNFVLMLDVCATRLQGAEPMAVAVAEEQSTDEDAIRGGSSAEARTQSKLEAKIHVWERKLLDLTLRNPLLNLEKGSHLLPLQEHDVDSVLGCLGKKEFVSLLTAKDSVKSLKSLYTEENRAVKDSGTDPLFLTVGTMKWFEEGSSVPHFAPIILVPVNIQKLANNSYTVLRSDEDAIINLTLVECMRQLFDIDTDDFTTLPLRKDGEIDYERVFASLRESISLKSTWEIGYETMLGIFSFEKFVLWHDVHTGEAELAKSAIIQSLAEGQVLWQEPLDEQLNAAAMDSQLSPMHLTLPIDADSSQMMAVAAAAKGRSFVLHGPPGTGKSQTITNIIADSLRRGKRVCFVSQKKAALEVVQDRMEKIGLGPFSLELHSKKANKKQFLSQLDEAINAANSIGASQPLEAASEQLFNKRKELLAYIEALHCTMSNGLSLHDHIERYSAIEGEEMVLDYRDIASLGWDDVETICSLLGELDIVESILKCHPASHGLCGLLAKGSDLQLQQRLEVLLANLGTLVAYAEGKEQSLLNRIFLRKSALHYATKSPVWSELCELCYVDSIDTIDDMREVSERWSHHSRMLLQWLQYCRRAVAIYNYAVGRKVLHWYLEGHKSGRAAADAFKKGYLACMASHHIASNESLRFFEGRLFAEVIANYKRLSQGYQALVRQELCAALAARSREAMVQQSQAFAALKRVIFSNGRRLSVRMIMGQCSDIITRLTPCVLMSPLSVAQFLELNRDLFDLIIFDEASQMPTCEAIGAIARGKSFIVVGDPKQLPPTSFFDRASNYLTGNAMDDLDSILEDSIAINMPSRYLKWHYRSRHESLIAFSNNNFYEGKLVTFPSVDDRDKKVLYKEVKGYYDFAKTRSNKEEAKAIVADVIARLEDAVSRQCVPDSIGIIAFSKAQSSLIENTLADELSRRGDLDECLASMREEIIVKNLESVQGDERDVILFSIGYGPDKKGRVSMNFGPLNNAGGERRLNVAVSRARKEMVVYATLKPEMIDLQKSSAKGVIYLKRFLEYARDGVLPVPYNQVSCLTSSTIAEEIAAYLNKCGYICDMNVGKSDFRIDVAVRSATSNSYCLGIVLDGAIYRNTPTMRDRELVRPQVLRALGWRIARVWSIDWMYRKEAILNELSTMLTVEQNSEGYGA